MTQIIVFKSQLARVVEQIIERQADKAAGDYYVAFCAHGESPTSPSFVGIDDVNIPRDVVARVYRAAQSAYNYACPTKPQPTAEQVEFARLDDQCKWGVATTQERAQRDALAKRGIARA